MRLVAFCLHCAVVTSCPAGSTAPSGKCLWLTDASATHHDCDQLCGSGAALACLSSADDAAYAAGLVTQASEQSSGPSSEPIEAWIGYYQANSADVEPWNGWACASGEATEFANFGAKEPDDGFRGCVHSEENCAALWSGENNGTTGTWRDSSCLSKSRCLCEHGAAASAAYNAFVEGLEELEGRVVAWEKTTPRVLSFDPTVYSKDIHSPGRAQCPCLQASERFGTRASTRGNFYEWKETYKQRKKISDLEEEADYLDFGSRYGIGCADHDNHKPIYGCGAPDPEARGAFCSEQWCYVDPDTCGLDSYSSIYKAGLKWSSMACEVRVNVNNEEDVRRYNECQRDYQRALVEASFATDIATLYPVMLALWLLPPLLFLAHRLLTNRGGKRQLVSVAPASTTTTTSDATAVTEEVSTWRRRLGSQKSLPVFRDPSEVAAIKVLAKAEADALALRRSVGGATVQLGWMLLVVALLPWIFLSQVQLDSKVKCAARDIVHTATPNLNRATASIPHSLPRFARLTKGGGACIAPLTHADTSHTRRVSTLRPSHGL